MAGVRRLGDPDLRGARVRLEVDGRQVEAHVGETVAGALLAAGADRVRLTARDGEPRGMYCGMGVCFECLLTIDGRANSRACMTAVRDGMRIDTQGASALP